MEPALGVIHMTLGPHPAARQSEIAADSPLRIFAGTGYDRAMTSEHLLSGAAMFWSAFLAATLLPGASEVVLAASLVERTADPWLLVALATLGNTLGSLVNWMCGRFLIAFRERRWFPVSPRHIDRFTRVFQRYGVWTLLLAWAPIGGDALTVVAGIARVNVVVFLVLVGAGKLARYLVVAAGVLAWPWF